MKKKNINLSLISDAMCLVNLASRVNGNVWLSDGIGSRVSGKSILGVFNVTMGGVVTVEYPEDAEELDGFLSTF